MGKQTNRPEIIFENENFVVINKPSGLLSIPDRVQSEMSLKDMLIHKYREIFTVHRLDKGTSGVIVFAKNEQTHKQLSQSFEGREVEKYYIGIVHGKMQNKEGTIDAPIAEKKGRMSTHIKGKPSVTDYSTIENFRLFSW